MVGCTRQSSFDAATFREAFRKNSHVTSEDAMQEDQSILHHSLVNVLKIDTPQLVRSGSSGIPVLSSVECSLDRGECSSIVKSECITDGDGVSQRDGDDSGIAMPSFNRGKAKCLPSGGCAGPILKPLDHSGSEQRPETTLDEKIASRTMDESTILSFRPFQLAAGINYFRGLQDRVAGREGSASVLGGQMRRETKFKSIHCRIHARDYSDCISLHFNRPLHLSPHEAMMNAVKEALERNRNTSALALASPAAEMCEVTADSTSTSERDSGMKVSIPGDSGNRIDDRNPALLNCAGVNIRQRPIGQEEWGGIGKKPASEQSAERKRGLLEQNIACDRIVRKKAPVDFKSYAAQDRGFCVDRNGTVAFVQNVFANVKVENLTGCGGKNDRVGGCALKPEDARPSNDVNAKGLLHKWERRKIFVMTENSGDGKEDLAFFLTDCGKTCRKQSSGEFEGKCKVQTTETRSNPLDVLGPDIILKVLSVLDARSLARCGVLSKDWKALAHLDSLWVSQCAKLWEGKIHLPCSALRHGLPKVVAYSRSVQDAKRTRITSKDLCDHIWEFRFTSAAPSYWLSLDPAQRGEAPMQRFFHMDGSQTAAPGDEVWGGHECFYSIVSEKFADGSVEHFVQINHWPYMSVSRTRDWGWVFNNRVHDYQSIPDSWKQGGTGPL